MTSGVTPRQPPLSSSQLSHGSARTHLAFVFDEAVVPELAALRHRFDPVMAAGVPPHTTVVYPEEYTDVELLIEWAEAIAARTKPFTLRGIGYVVDGD